MIGIVYGALVAMVQPDIKKLVAYSSVSHLGFVMLGIWAGTVQSLQGALMVMIGHGISTGALFFLVGMLYERRHTREIADYGGIARVVPAVRLVLHRRGTLVDRAAGTQRVRRVSSWCCSGSFGTFPYATVIATTGVIFAAAYLLWALQRIIFNRLDNPENEKLTDLTGRELRGAGAAARRHRLDGPVSRARCSTGWSRRRTATSRSSVPHRSGPDPTPSGSARRWRLGR